MPNLPLRSEVKEEYTWDLTKIYASKEAWKKDFCRAQKELKRAKQFKGKLGESPEKLLEALNWQLDNLVLITRLHVYAYLQKEVDIDDVEVQEVLKQIRTLSSNFRTATNYMKPEIAKIKDLDKWLETGLLDDYKSLLIDIKGTKYLSKRERELFASLGDIKDSIKDAYDTLSEFEIYIGKNEDRDVTLKDESCYNLMLSQNRDMREIGYNELHEAYKEHERTLANLYAGSIKHNVLTAKLRGYTSTLEAALDSDDIPMSVFTNLIDVVHKALPLLHRYYAIRKKILGVDELHIYDIYVPLVDSVQVNISYENAAQLIKESVLPLGLEYSNLLYAGLTKERWVDRYPNEGKSSLSHYIETYTDNPYILLNYKGDSIEDVIELAHESGHAMQGYYSVHNNTFFSYVFPDFANEVASKFHEQLLVKYLYEHAESEKVKTYLLGMQLDCMISDLFLQTLYSEFEVKCHIQQEKGEPLTLDFFLKTYKGLLETYYGPEMHFEENSDVGGLCVHHFYNDYYVYKYATGLSAAIALSERVLNGGEKERQDYLDYLKLGSTKTAIEGLKVAGVDMTTVAPIEATVKKFANLLDDFEKRIG